MSERACEGSKRANKRVETVSLGERRTKEVQNEKALAPELFFSSSRSHAHEEKK